MNKLILVRHGQHEYNVKHLVCGLAEAHLTDKGWQEARDLGTFFREENFDFKITTESPLIRCIETRQGFEQTYGKIPKNEVIFRAHEHDYGSLEGKNVQTELGRDTWTVDDVYALQQDPNKPLKKYNVEPWENVCRRAAFSAKELKSLAIQYKEIGHFGHGLFNSVIAHYLLFPEDTIPGQDMTPYHASTGEYHTFELDDNGIIIQWKPAKGELIKLKY